MFLQPVNFVSLQENLKCFMSFPKKQGFICFLLSLIKFSNIISMSRVRGISNFNVLTMSEHNMDPHREKQRGGLVFFLHVYQVL